jgi:type I restriction enzyme M protein
LNLTRYISTAKPEEKIDLRKVHSELVNIENNILEATTEVPTF